MTQISANILLSTIQLFLAKNSLLEYFWNYIKETSNTGHLHRRDLSS